MSIESWLVYSKPIARLGSAGLLLAACIAHTPAMADAKLGKAALNETRTATPRLGGGVFTYADGTRVEANDPSGRTGTAHSDGTIEYADGTRVAHDSSTGETITTRPDGTETSHNSRLPTRTGDLFTFNDGIQVRATDRNGGQGKVNADGTISFPDGTRVSHDITTGDTKIFYADGHVELRQGSGAAVDRSGNFRWSDGVAIPGTDPSGGQGRMTRDGWIEFPNGTRVSHDTSSGDTKIVMPDGSVIVRNERTGERTTTRTSATGSGSSTPGQSPASAIPGQRSNSGSSSRSSQSPSAAQTSRTSQAPQNGQTSRSGQSSQSGQTGRTEGQSSRQSNSGQASSSQSSSNRQTSTQSADKPKESSQSSSQSAADRPQQEGDKPKNKDARLADSNSVGGTGVGSAPRLVIRGLSTTGQPVPDQGSGNSGSTPVMSTSIGPGGRTLEQRQPASRGSRVNFDRFGLVVNPDPNRLAGVGEPPPIDPFGGRR
jgi:hypothetical protein